jgi:hypothetical protein
MSDIKEEIEKKAVSWFNTDKQRNTLLIMLIGMSIILFFSLRSCSTNKNDLQISNQNNKALSDSVRVSKNKVGQLEASKNVLITEKNGLKELNADLASELKKEKGRVYELNKFILGIKNKPGDTIKITNTVIIYPNGEYGLAWHHDTIYSANNSRNIIGVSKFRLKDSTVIPTQTLITKDEINFSLVTGLREKGDNLEIFIRSDYPGFNALNIDGAIIDPKKNPVFNKYVVQKKWGVGPYLGVGIGSNLKPSLQIGIGIHYSLLRF